MSKSLNLAQPRCFTFCQARPEIIKLFSCSTQLSIKFTMLINVKMPTIVGILTFINKINTTSERWFFEHKTYAKNYG